MTGAEAVQKILKTIDSQTKNDQMVEELFPNSKLVVSSCRHSATIICNILGNAGKSVDTDFDPVPVLNEKGKKTGERLATQEEKAEKIIAKLKSSPVLIQLIPNHFFIIIPINDKFVSIMQGFEESYTLFEWIDKTKNGYINRSDLNKYLKWLISNNQNEKKSAILGLFAYSHKAVARELEPKIIKYFQGEIQFKHCTSLKI